MDRFNIQNKKAESFICSMAIIMVKYKCILPENAQIILAIPEVGLKKTTVTLGAVGIYNRCGLGPGADVHYDRLFGPIAARLYLDGPKNLHNRVLEVNKWVPSHHGREAK